MVTILAILLILSCLVLMLFVLIQNPKGGGLTSNAGGSTQLFGVQKTADILEKGTWVCIALVALCSFGINYMSKNSDLSNQEQSRIKKQIEKASVPSAATPSNGAVPPANAPIGNLPK